MTDYAAELVIVHRQLVASCRETLALLHRSLALIGSPRFSLSVEERFVVRASWSAATVRATELSGLEPKPPELPAIIAELEKLAGQFADLMDL